MPFQRDYSFYAFFITVAVIAGVVALSWLPKFEIAGITFKKTNILSDIIRQEEHPELLGADQYFDTTFLSEADAMKVIDSATRSAAKEGPSLPEAKHEEWNLGSNTPSAAPVVLTKPAEVDKTVIPIETFSPNAMQDFNTALRRGTPGRPVRIAVLGDSFIEGDIITADLREQLQNLCGGRGVGFVPFASPLAKFRGTVQHSYDKWTLYNIRDRSQPTEVKGRFFVSGFVCKPQEGATTRLKGVTFRKHIDQASSARLIFTNEQNTLINVVINDSVSRLFAPEPSPHVQQIVINAPIRSISVTLTQTAGFTGYGIVLEDPTGISVDNYSIRGNSGMTLFQTNSSVNAQIGQVIGYDLIVLQYGLNVMSPDVLKYDSYSKTFARIIDYVKQCFPHASILVMGIGDRSTLRDGQFVTMPSVRGMIEAQRSAAQSTGVAFWNTFEAMGGENSMVSFVQKKWAAQDHTHIRYPGGKYIAHRFAAALVHNGGKQPPAQGTEVPLFHGAIPGGKPQQNATSGAPAGSEPRWQPIVQTQKPVTKPVTRPVTRPAANTTAQSAATTSAADTNSATAAKSGGKTAATGKPGVGDSSAAYATPKANTPPKAGTATGKPDTATGKPGMNP